MEFTFKIFSLTEKALTIQFPPQISWELIQHMHSFKYRVAQSNIEGILNIEVSFYEVTIFFDPAKIDRTDLTAQLKNILINDPAPEEPFPSPNTHRIPVCYDPELALDSSKMENHTGLDFEEIIHLHTQSEMHVFMLGFLPGFVYLGGMNKKISCPRHTIPRKVIPRGSVGIAGLQTGIYPIESPGGWNIIGRSPLRFFPKNHHPDIHTDYPIQALDTIHFVPITRQEYEKWEGIDLHSYLMKTKGK